VKKAIELLQTAKKRLCDIYGLSQSTQLEIVSEACQDIERAIAELKAPPRWETTEQHRKRTGRDWPENALVYYRYAGAGEAYVDSEWGYVTYKRIRGFVRHQIVCATEAGRPPDDWKPEEATP
jgi:hypothetical protein